jgi:hypothetical protein
VKDLLKVAATCTLASATVNGPLLLVNWHAWLAPYQMQSVRPNLVDTNSMWAWLLPVTSFSAANQAAAFCVGASWVVILTIAWAAWRDNRTFPWLQASAAMLSTYLLVGRVDSPQYTLWILPFVALFPVRGTFLAAYFVSDSALWLSWSTLANDNRSFLWLVVGFRMAMLAALTVHFIGHFERGAEQGDPSRTAPLAEEPLAQHVVSTGG